MWRALLLGRRDEASEAGTSSRRLRVRPATPLVDPR
jgi:hypothetical protein